MAGQLRRQVPALQVGGPAPAPGPDPSRPNPPARSGPAPQPTPQPSPGPAPPPNWSPPPSSDPFGISRAMGNLVTELTAGGQLLLGALLIAVGLALLAGQTQLGGAVARSAGRAAGKAVKTAAMAAL